MTELDGAGHRCSAALYLRDGPAALPDRPRPRRSQSVWSLRLLPRQSGAKWRMQAQ
jgi:hypothetical protein